MLKIWIVAYILGKIVVVTGPVPDMNTCVQIVAEITKRPDVKIECEFHIEKPKIGGMKT